MQVNITGKNVLSVVQLALLVLIAGLLVWSQPWNDTATKEQRTITVNGQATIEAEPDEYIFSPYFEVEGDDEEAAKTEITQLANDAVEAIKALGVEDSAIKLDASSYDRWYWNEGETGTLQAYIQVTVSDKELAQEVQDYLLTTAAKGQLTSQETFSEAKQDELEQQAIDEASVDARARAETQAKLFGAELGDVITVNPQGGIDYPIALERAEVSLQADASQASLPVLPGTQDYRQSVTVTFELK